MDKSNGQKFRLRLNLFDAIVLILAVAAAAALFWSARRPAPTPTDDVTSVNTAGAIHYTIRFQRCVPGTADAVREGARLTESVRNYELGNVLSAQAAPAEGLRLDVVDRKYAMVTMEGYEDVIVEVESPCTITEEAVTLSDGYVLRTGATIYVQGDGFLATGYVAHIDREG